MIITKIERQKKNKQRFSIFLDDRYAFSVSEDVYSRFVLHSGQELSEQERNEIEQAETESSVKKTALRFRSYRPRSEQQVAEHLRKKGFDETNIRQAIGYLHANSLLNDREFAKMFCRDSIQLKPVGRQSMKHLLMKKGIAAGIIDDVLQEYYNEETERTLAMNEGKRKFKRVASLPPLMQKKRIYEHLLRRGYHHALSMTIASELVHQ